MPDTCCATHTLPVFINRVTYVGKVCRGLTRTGGTGGASEPRVPVVLVALAAHVVQVVLVVHVVLVVRAIL